VHPGDKSRVSTDVELAAQLRDAVDAGQLIAYYQPQYDLTSGRIVAFEALCRWRHPHFGLLLPARFIDIAERHGLIAEIGRFMLAESGRTAADWHRRGAHPGMSINVSPTELNPGFAATVLKWVREFDLPYRSLTVEVTESPAISYSRAELFALETLIDGGVGVSIDDFGSDRSSLDLVKRLPLTEVKIDKSLVHDSAEAIDDLVQLCVGIARERDALIVAEGVETQDHVDRARLWACDRAQGYFFSPPLPVEEAEPLLLGAA
jgi:EAL domain-containing protein (putative c-di-GMP-specific phosphodiesterase class I)